VFKLFTKLDYLLRETLLGLRRGGWMNWAAISTVTVLLFLFGVSLQASWQVEGLLNQFGSQLEISAYLKTGVPADALRPIVEDFPGVASVISISKEEAWAQLVAELGISDIEAATRQLNGNPLVDALSIKAATPDDVAPLAAKLEDLQGVDDVQYINEAVTQITQLSAGLNGISLAIILVLSLTAIAVITTTIRLIVMARRREIEVMQLVGATTTWVYLPFILQGVAFGFIGAIAAWGLVSGLRGFVMGLLRQQPEFIQVLANGLQLTVSQLVFLPLALLGLGGTVGLLGSLFAVRRFASR
jgi:cell division transport system permease protein